MKSLFPQDDGRQQRGREDHPAARPHLVKVEANLLRLPLFALSTKGLRTLDGIACRGTITRGGKTHDYTFRATRNTATLYPGPLSRSAHLALLSIVTERGLPTANPIAWTWGDLCRRMGIVCSGRTVLLLKAALAATRGLIIDSQHAVYAKPDDRLLTTTQRQMSLYDQLTFINGRMPDGSVADGNYVWLADWYLDNLNALFTAPLDYDLWRWLDRRSPIASRLYEFSLLVFYSGTPLLRINYPTLARYLPVRPERYFSLARRQLSLPFKLLVLQDIIKTVAWQKTKTGVFQLLLHPGPRVRALADRNQPLAALVEEHFTSDIEVQELRNLKPPEWTVVSDFYHRWAQDSNHRPTKRELEQARQFIDEHGAAKAKAIIPVVVKLMKKRWPDAKTFGAATKYLGDAATAYHQEQRQKRHSRQDRLDQQQEQHAAVQRRREEAHFHTTWLPVWEGLSDHDREEIRQAVVGNNELLRNHPDSSITLMLCLKEVARRQEGKSSGSGDP